MADEANVEVTTPVEDAENTEAVESVETTEPVKTTRTRVKREVFMRVWEETVAGLKNETLEGSGIKIVAERLGLGQNNVQQRSTKYRKVYGLDLSKMPRGGGAKFNTTAAAEELAVIKEAIAKANNAEVE